MQRLFVHLLKFAFVLISFTSLQVKLLYFFLKFLHLFHLLLFQTHFTFDAPHLFLSLYGRFWACGASSPHGRREPSPLTTQSLFLHLSSLESIKRNSFISLCSFQMAFFFAVVSISFAIPFFASPVLSPRHILNLFWSNLSCSCSWNFSLNSHGRVLTFSHRIFLQSVIKITDTSSYLFL
jgi:hypothetical protein